MMKYLPQIISITQIVQHIIFVFVVQEGNSSHLVGESQVRKC